MGITGRQQIRALSQSLANASKEFHSDVDREMEKMVPIAKDRLDSYSDAQKNRISGNMVNALKARYEPKDFALRVGFIDGYQPNERGDDGLYMKLQTVTGFNHGGFIAPSLAIKDTQEDMRQEMNSTISRIRRNFMQRLRRRG